ncbi:MAG: DNA-directed RNA polymerase subunit beta', partial [Caldilineae bacterium]
RTFHTGGVAGSDDITQGLPRVEELFEVRNPKGEAVISEIDGIVDIYWEGDQRMLKVSRTELRRRVVDVPEGYEIVVDNDDRVQEDTIVARHPEDPAQEVAAGMEGNVFIEDGQVIIRREDTEVWETDIPANARLRVQKGDEVHAGEQLTEGSKNPKEILRIQGREACQLYLLEQVQQVYRSQGVSIHDKHIEVVLRQLLRRVMIRATGDTEFLPGELVDRFEFEDVNNAVVAQGGRPAKAEAVVLGLTKAALNTESFLAAASFQETTRVLTEAAIRGQRDDLRGLKENVIIGKLIPVGTGFRARRRWAQEKQEAIALAARQKEAEEEEEFEDLELADLDEADLDMTDLSGLAEMGLGPLGMLSSFTSGLDEDEIDIDFDALKDEEDEEIDVDLG